jgi:hydrogenase expression/formation protein HypE
VSNNNGKDKVNLSAGFNCPLPITDYDTVQLAHGSGGKMMSDLIDKMFVGTFDNPTLSKMEDQANLNIGNQKLSFTTDTFVVDPLFFPGGNIGELAVNGTVNDICMNGAAPLYLSAAFIIEEGFHIADLHKIVLSMKETADKAGVSIVTGDTKVVNKGSCDKVFINTAGVGVLEKDCNISASNLKEGDKIILSGTIADHGMAIMTTRKELSFETRISSDTASLNGLVDAILKDVPSAVHAMRDPTRGGIAATLNEFAVQSNKGIRIYADQIPMREEVKAVAEILGINPYFAANEGKMICVVDSNYAEGILEIMRNHPLGKDAAIIGEVTADSPGMVLEKNILGIEQIIDLPMGEQLPRIC